MVPRRGAGAALMTAQERGQLGSDPDQTPGTMQPHIATARLRLTPATDADVDALWSLWKDPQVRLYLWDDIEIDRERARATIGDAAAVSEQGLGLWTITPAEPTGALMGCAALLPVGTSAEYYPAFAGAVEPLIALAPAFWGRGYALEALTTLIEYATGTLRLDRLVAVNDVPNAASDRLLQRLGFVSCAETDGPRYRLRHYTFAR
jgi:[ribosomal protein S5]-alanine N-acetyltransferase